MKFFVNINQTSTIMETKENLNNAKVYTSMNCNPIFIAGKDVPHRELATTVNRIASFLLEFACCFDFCKDYSVISEKSMLILMFC